MKKFRQMYNRLYSNVLLRPIIYKSVARFAYALTVLLLLDHFVNFPGFAVTRRLASPIIGCVFLMLAWFCYLRLDGVHLPWFLRSGSVKIKKKKPFAYGDIADYTDQHIVSFEELNDEQRELTILISNLICGCIFLILALF